MQKSDQQANSKLLSDSIICGMLEKKAEEIVILDLRKVYNAVADYFILCSGNSDTQIDAIFDSVEKEVKKSSGQTPWHKEGRDNKEWVLIDYIDVVAHIFNKEKRLFYGLEELWGDTRIQKLKIMN